MSSRSSSSGERQPLLLGRVAGHRGAAGELTVRVPSGHAEGWTGLRRVRITAVESDVDAVGHEVEAARAYRDRLVLKLAGIDDGNAAEELRGHWVWAPSDEVPELPEGRYYQQRLIGLLVVDEGPGAELGTVSDVLETGGSDLLVVETAAGGEILVPFAGEIVLGVDESRGRIEVRLPDGLLELSEGREERQ